MRLVAAARVRRAQEAVLKTRPLLSQLQLVSAHFQRFFVVVWIEIASASIFSLTFFSHTTFHGS
jgi:hypothetical protein